MRILPKRTLPAVGHKIPLQSIYSSLIKKREAHDLSIFNKSTDIVYTSSGSAALLTALRACKISSQRNKVIIPAYTCPSVLAAIEAVGLKAVLCDLSSGSGRFSLSEKHLGNLLNEDTLAVIYVNLFGLDWRDTNIYKYVRSRGVYLIEDIAQAFGTKVDGQLLGTDGDLSILSFGRGKPLSVLHGGAVVVNSPQLREPVLTAMRKWSQPIPAWFGIYYRILLLAYSSVFHPRFFALPQILPWLHIGETLYSEKITIKTMAKPAQKVLRQLLKKFRRIQQRRATIAIQYLQKLIPLARFFTYMPTTEEITTGPIRFPVIFKDWQHKLECLNLLSEMRLGASGSYPVTLNSLSSVPNYVALQGPFTQAESVARGILTLPTHEYVEKQDIESMVNIISSVVK